MLTEMAVSSDRVRFKDKIISNIAKAIKGIQEAVFFKSKTTTDDSPLVLRNNDRQCHKLCENLDHVFLHGLRQHTHGYWKVVTEYTHKNAVKEIKNLRNVTTDLGRGRAWIFMALNDALLESYIRCVTEHTKMLKKHYDKDALLLDQQQMSVLLTLTSGLECVVFQLEYDLPYLDLTAYPPRTRTASEVEEEEEEARLSGRSLSASSHINTETIASTPESTKALTDSDTASLSSLDTSALRSARVSSVSMDSGFPGDVVSLQSSKQRSVTPIDNVSISSHGSAGEPDRLTRLENIVSHTNDTEETDGAGLEVIRVKGGKKLSGAKKKRSSATKKDIKRVTSQMSADTITGLTDQTSKELHRQSSAPITITSSLSAASLEESSCGKSPSSLNGSLRKSSLYGKSPQGGKSPPTQESPSPSMNDSGSFSDKAMLEKAEGVEMKGECSEAVTISGPGREVERLAAETKDSLADGFAQLDTAMASVRATATSLHQHQDIVPQPNPHQPLLLPSSPFQTTEANYGQHSPVSFSRNVDVYSDPSDDFHTDCTNTLPPNHVQVPADNHPTMPMSALEELESKCAELCRPMSRQNCDSDGLDLVDTVHISQQDSQVFCESRPDEKDLSASVNSVSGSKQAENYGHPMSGEEEEEIDFYTAPSKVGVQTNKAPGCSHLDDYMDYISGHHSNERTTEGPVEMDREGNIVETVRRDWNKDYAIRLDNNTKLQIMLDVFSRDDEEFIKMFVSREGHSEGEQKVMFVLVTNHALYLLKQRDTDRKFETDLSMPLKDLSFISLSLNKQIVNIESSGPNRRKERIWLTPGDHLLAQQMVDCLEGAIKLVHEPSTLRSHFSMGSDEPLQIIALRKYIARDSQCQEHEVEVEDYSLVFWEDGQANKNKPTSAAREGTMLLRVNDPFKGHIWKPVYVVLRDFMLCVYANKTDSKPQHYVRLGGEQCVGCRLATSQERLYCIEIILATGASWFLSVPTEEEVASWRQSLCLAVSEGMQDSSNLTCLPCVSVVTGHKLLLCHEDVQTKFCRTIASAKVEEVTALLFDPDINTYCVIEFESQESGVSSERWVLYFNSPLEMDRFVQALSKVWQNVYQVSLSSGVLEDLPLQKHCHDQVSLLQRAISMK